MKKVQTLYESPKSEIVEIKPQAILCLSGDLEEYNYTEDPDWFGMS